MRTECARASADPYHASADPYRIAALLRLIVTDLTRPTSARRPSASLACPQQRSFWAIEHARRFMLENISRPITLDEIAFAANLSGEHLSRKFKAATGTTIFECLRRLRIDHAKALHTSSGLPVCSIAEKSGFASPGQFCRTFKELTGLTPGQFREHQIPEADLTPDTLVPG